ncbi:pinin [Centruroides vittatus]|uniref:pinin n=1 Tax=Centruroides vittatus TaxID=120091 RepID=UPI00350F0CEE
MAALTVYASLKEEFEEAQNSLKNVDENIKRLTGRNPGEFRIGVKRIAGGNVVGDAKNNVSSALWQNANTDISKPKRRLLGSAFSRLGVQTEDLQKNQEDSGDDDDTTTKPTIQSSVVATTKEIRTRKETIEEQKGDKKNMERNRRMFGMILGTLQKFQHEESQRKEQAQKRAEIEQKLETAAEKEKEELRKERQELFLARREKQAQIRRLEQKIEIAKMHEEWEAKQRLMMNFIFTKAKPPIMFLPAKHTPESEKRHKDSQKKIEAAIKSQRAKIEEELKEIDELYKKEALEDEELDQAETCVDKENRGPAEIVIEENPEVEMKEEVTVSEEAKTTEPAERIEVEVQNSEEKTSVTPVIQEQSEQSAETENGEKEVGEEKIGSLGDQEFEPIYD